MSQNTPSDAPALFTLTVDDTNVVLSMKWVDDACIGVDLSGEAMEVIAKAKGVPAVALTATPDGDQSANKGKFTFTVTSHPTTGLTSAARTYRCQVKRTEAGRVIRTEDFGIVVKEKAENYA